MCKLQGVYIYIWALCNQVDRLVFFSTRFPNANNMYRIIHTAIIYTAEIVLYSLGTHSIRRRSLCNYNKVCCHSQLCICLFACVCVYVCVCVCECVFCFLGDFRRRSSGCMHRPQPSGDECVCACEGNLPETSLSPTSESQGFSSDDRQEFVQHDDRYTTTTYTRQKRSWHMRRWRWRWIYIGGSVIAADR